MAFTITERGTAIGASPVSMTPSVGGGYVFRHSGNNKKFYWYRWNPTWGGVTGGASHSGHTDDILTDDYALYGVA